MVIVYGADWCEDTRRSLRHLRRLSVAHRYINIDEDSEALEQAKSLNDGHRRTPTIDLGVGGPALVEPDNDTLSGALIELQMLTQEDVHERLGVQNVGDTERAVRASLGAAIALAAGALPRNVRRPIQALGLLTAISGVAGWCPFYRMAGVSSIGGPGDRADEAERSTWLARV